MKSAWGTGAEDGMHILLRKLTALHDISAEEQQAVISALGPPRTILRNSNIVPDQSIPQHTTVMLSGTACRYKLLPNGRRHILAFQYPGDMTDLYSYVLEKMDHAVGALSDCTIAQIPHDKITALRVQYPNLQYTFWRDTMIDASITNMWGIGASRETLSQVAHMLCEIFTRLEIVGLAKLGEPLPYLLTQKDLADALGLSLVHTNKRLAILKKKQLIRYSAAKMEILDWQGLADIANFDPVYLHLKGKAS
jgi:CRP-like cAMP-binding protein